MNLSNSKDRVRLLRIGIPGKQIEKLWIRENNMKVLNVPILIENL